MGLGQENLYFVGEKKYIRPLWTLACWDCGFESLRRHGRLSSVSVVFCLCDGRITRPEEFCRMWCVTVCHYVCHCVIMCHVCHYVCHVCHCVIMCVMCVTVCHYVCHCVTVIMCHVCHYVCHRVSLRVSLCAIMCHCHYVSCVSLCVSLCVMCHRVSLCVTVCHYVCHCVSCSATVILFTYTGIDRSMLDQEARNISYLIMHAYKICLPLIYLKF